VTFDWLQVALLFVWGISLGMAIAIEIIERIERKRPKTLNLPIAELQAIAPGQVMTLKLEQMELAVLGAADLEYVAEKAGMVLKSKTADAAQARKA
jgi:hypothetical protein